MRNFQCALLQALKMLPLCATSSKTITCIARAMDDIPHSGSSGHNPVS